MTDENTPAQPVPVADGNHLVLVSVKTLEDWRQQANSCGAWTLKADRTRSVVKLKSSIREVIECAPSAVDAAKYDALLASEHALSAAYVRLREILGAMAPPQGASAETLWSYVEGVARDLVATEKKPARLTELPSGAIENGRIYFDRLASFYEFHCEAGPLRDCHDWQMLRECFDHLVDVVSSGGASQPVANCVPSGPHTQGRITFSVDGEVNRYVLFSDDGRWWLSALKNGEMVPERQIANMRRLAACWNALESLPTDRIEAGDFLRSHPDPVAYCVPSARASQDGSMEDGPDSLVFASDASEYEKKVGAPLVCPAHQPGPVATITGMDEFGPMLEWKKTWTAFDVGSQFFVVPPQAAPLDPTQAAWSKLGPLIDAHHIVLSPPESRVHRHGGNSPGWGPSGFWGGAAYAHGLPDRPAAYGKASALEVVQELADKIAAGKAEGGEKQGGEK